MLRPKIAILDELDSGLDIDALRDCARRVEEMSNDSSAGEPLGVLAITHYSRLLAELRPDHVHILVKGRIVAAAAPSSPTWRQLRGRRRAAIVAGAAGAPTSDDRSSSRRPVKASPGSETVSGG